MNEDRKKILDSIIKSIEKNHGKGSVTTLNKKPLFDENRVIRSGSLGLDLALGIGGYPRSRVIEIYGLESSGKTTLCLHAIKNEQENGGLCAFIDTEHALDVTYANSLGVDTEMLLLSQPDFGEQALDIVEAIARSGDVSLIIVDSVASLVPQSELEGDMSTAAVGTQARLMSKAMRKITPVLNSTNCTIIFTNQIRMKIGVMFGSPETTTGGNALKFYASQRLDIRRIGAIKKGEDIIGNETRVKVIKNKVSSPFKEAKFRIMYGTGIDSTGEILDFSIDEGLIGKSGSWYSYDGERIGQGRENAISWLAENKELATMLKEMILEKKGLVSAGQVQQPDSGGDPGETEDIG